MNLILFPEMKDQEKNLLFYLHGIADKIMIEKSYRPKGSEFDLWIQTRSGSGYVIIESEKYTINKDQGLWIPAHITYELFTSSDEWIIDMILFSGSGIPLLDVEGLLFHSPLVVTLENLDNFDRLYAHLIETQTSHFATDNLHRSALIYEILLEIIYQAKVQNSMSDQKKDLRLLPVMDFIQKNYKEEIKLVQLAEIAQVTPQHFCTIFKKYNGIRIFEYINKIRIQESKKILLTDLNKSIKEVARDSGIDDISYYVSIFKRYTGYTPGEYRKLYNFNL